jgi:hypothetical protein
MLLQNVLTFLKDEKMKLFLMIYFFQLFSLFSIQ